MYGRTLFCVVLGLALSTSASAQNPDRGTTGGDRVGGGSDGLGAASSDRGVGQNAGILDTDEGGENFDATAAQAADSEGLDQEVAASAAAMTGAANSRLAKSSCATPRAAVEVLLHWLQPERYNVARAAQCVSRTGFSRREVRERVVQIKRFMDTQGLLVRLRSIPGDSNYENSLGENRFTLFPDIPELMVEKVGARWVWSAETMEAVPRLYEQTFLLEIESYTKDLPEWMQDSYFGVRGWQYVALILLFILGYFVRGVVTVLVSSQGQRLLSRIRIMGDAQLLGDIGRPLGTLAAAGLVAAILPSLGLPVRLVSILLLATRVVAAASAVWAAYYVVDVFARWLSQRAERTHTKLDDQLVPLISRASKIFIVAFGALFVLQNAHVNVTGLLTGFGIGGIAFALAAKDTVANLFGSATIFASRPFQIGDWVYIDGSEGVVEAVGFRATKIRTFYNSLITIPNAKVADAAVDNYGARKFRRLKATLGLTYDTSPEQMQAYVEGVRAIIAANPHTKKDFYEVHFYDFGPSSLNILVYAFLDVPTWSDELRARHNMFLEFIRLAKRLNVDFAFPTQTLHVESMANQGTAPSRKVPTEEELAAAVASFGPEGDASTPENPTYTHGYLAGSP